MLVDPRDYRAFCFRGEGRANFVISAKCERTGLRFPKKRKSGTVTVSSHKSELVNEYMERLIAPFFHKKQEHGEKKIHFRYMVTPKIVEFSARDVHQLAKIPQLRHNLKVESFEELSDERRFPATLSFLPLSAIPQHVHTISALEMLDATRIPKRMQAFHGPTITIEIKPKQGFLQKHPGVDSKFCNNCVLQMEKCADSSSSFHTMYDFCPLDLFSGSLERMRNAVYALLAEPHRHLRVFIDGDVVHGDCETLSMAKLEEKLGDGGRLPLTVLVDALCCVLAGQRSVRVGTDDSPSSFHLAVDSVLGQILAAQKIDPVGIVRAHELFLSLPPHVQKELAKRATLASRGLSLLEGTDARSQVEKYLVAGTMKDCSIMATLRQVLDSELTATVAAGHEVVHVRANTPRVASANSQPRRGSPSSPSRGRVFHFAFSIKIVDLDPKSPKNLENAFLRFSTGLALLHERASLRAPCVP